MGDRESTTTTVNRVSFSGISAFLTYGSIMFAYSRNLRPVDVLVAGLAKRYSIRDIISKIWAIFPFFLVMCLEIVLLAALLAGVAISRINGFSPLAIPSGIAFFIGIVLCHRSISASFSTKLSAQMSVLWIERFTTEFAYKLFFCSIPAGVNGRTMPRASFGIKGKVGEKWCSANSTLTGCILASITVMASWIWCNKRLTTNSTGYCSKSDRWFAHSFYYTTDPTIQRWIDSTGGEAVLLNGD